MARPIAEIAPSPSPNTKLTLLPARETATVKLPSFYFRDRGGWVLLTNDCGYHVMMEAADFELYAAGRMSQEHPLWQELLAKGFIREGMDFQALAKKFASKNEFLWYAGPSLHMIVVTLRCNQKCHYCHASVVDPSRTDMDMSVETAKRTVDFIFSTPNPSLCIEFQGGEPLVNWPVVQFIVEYAHKRASWEKRRLLLSLVSNFTLLNDERADYLLKRHVSLCTSLDGPAQVHDKNRPLLGGGPSHEKVVAALKRIQDRCRGAGEKTYYLPSALMTTTRFSLPYGKEIVDQYVELGMGQIFLRALAPIGFAKRVWGEIGYSSKEFVEFYEKTLDYILDLNHQGTEIVERLTLVLLTKILKQQDPGYMDLRSPSGAGLSAVAYNYNGDVYAGDEGRMVAQEGDDLFKIGSVGASAWEQAATHAATRACAISSTLDGQTLCSQCAYKPYCGVEPVYHYETQNSIFGNLATSAWCDRHMGIFDVLFAKLRDPKARAIFERWLAQDRCMWQESGPEALENGKKN